MTDGPRLRVVSFNIHSGRPRSGPPDLRATARVLAALEADLLALQEVRGWLPGSSETQSQPRRLGALLGMEVRFLPSFGIGRFGYGNALLFRRMPAAVRRVRLPGRAEPRTLLEGRFEIGGRPFRCFNTHLGLSPGERLAQARRIAEHVTGAAEPLILAGDLNAGPESEEVRVLEEVGLRRCGGEGLRTFPCHSPLSCIDHVLVGPHWEVLECRVVDTEVSDHLPVVADLRLRP